MNDLPSASKYSIRGVDKTIEWLNEAIPIDIVSKKRAKTASKSFCASAPAVLIGSRVLPHYLSKDQLEAKELHPPIPYYARTVQQNNEIEKENENPDYDIIAPIYLIIDFLQNHRDEIIDVYVADDVNRLLIKTKTELLNIEPVLKKSAFNVLDDDGASSAEQIVNWASENQKNLKIEKVPLFGKCVVASIELLFCIGRSHVHFPIKWRKHIERLHYLMKLFPKKLKWHIADEPFQCIAKTRRSELVGLRGEPGKHINLNVTNEEFFDDENGVMARKRHVDHDKIHELVAYKGVPLYTTMKEDASKAMLSKAMFEAASKQDQIWLVKEEAYSIALERYLLSKRIPPSEGDEAYLLAIERVCTTLARGWFRAFACEHYPLVKISDRDLAGDVQHIEQNLKKFEIEKPVEIESQSTAHTLYSSELPPPLHLVFADPQIVPLEWCDVASAIMASWKTVSTDDDTQTASFQFNGKSHKVKIVSDLDRASFKSDYSMNSGSAQVDVKIDNKLIISAELEHIVEWYWDDSGCEWGGGGHEAMNERSVITTKFKKIPFAVGTSVPAFVVLAAVLATKNLVWQNKVVRKRILSQVSRYSAAERLAKPVLAEENLATLWALQEPIEYAVWSWRLHAAADKQAPFDFEPFALWHSACAPLREAVLHSVKNEQCQVPSITTWLPRTDPEQATMVAFLVQITSLRRITFITSSTQWNRANPKRFGIYTQHDGIVARDTVAKDEASEFEPRLDQLQQALVDANIPAVITAQ